MDTKQNEKVAKDEHVVPKQRRGRETSSEEVMQTTTKEAARKNFSIARKRLLDVNHWRRYGGITEFKLVDPDGKPSAGTPREGYYIRIDLPGPGPLNGRGYDWVCIEEIIDKHDPIKDEEIFGIRVRPCKAPGDHTTSHFYTSETTNNFLVHRVGKRVVASVKGRNEIFNTDRNRNNNLIDRLRNSLTGLFAVKGGSQLQWEDFLKGLLQP